MPQREAMLLSTSVIVLMTWRIDNDVGCVRSGWAWAVLQTNLWQNRVTGADAELTRALLCGTIPAIQAQSSHIITCTSMSCGALLQYLLAGCHTYEKCTCT